MSRFDYPEDVVKDKEVAPGIFMTNKKHWAMNSSAGEGLTIMNGDASGCLLTEKVSNLKVCLQPHVAIYRHYWSKKGKISCFLSYPDGMGYAKGKYFWEIYSLEGNLLDDIERFFTEKECEERIIELLRQRRDKDGKA